MSADPAKPRLAFILLTYKQEKYVREAVRAALAQDYENLEVVISDDASPDGTWRIIEEEVSSYRGPHRIVLNRNESNQGLIGNLYAAVRLTAAEYLVMAAGDDISVSTRASTIAKAFVADRGVFAIYSRIREVDQAGCSRRVANSICITGTVDPKVLATCGHVVVGASGAYRAEVFSSFEDIPRSVFAEDFLLPFRAALLGKILELEEVLVFYRMHSASLSFDLNAGSIGQLVLATGHSMASEVIEIATAMSDVTRNQRSGLLDPETSRTLLNHLSQRQSSLERVLRLRAWNMAEVARQISRLLLGSCSSKLIAKELFSGLFPRLWLYYCKLINEKYSHQRR